MSGGRIAAAVLAWLPLVVAAESLPGRLEWGRAVALGLPGEGIVERVTAAAGERVAAGALLLSLDAAAQQARVEAAQARHRHAELDYAEAKRELDRALELYDRTVLSDHERQQAEIGESRARAALMEARAALRAAETALGYRYLKAPFAGRLLQIVEPGSAIGDSVAPAVLAELADERFMRVRAALAGGQRGGLRGGATVVVRIGEQRLDAVVSRLTPREDGDGYLLEARFDPPPGFELWPGDPVMVEIDDQSQ